MQILKMNKTHKLKNNGQLQPILKWVGGKSKLTDKIMPLLPTHIKNYHEPFVGGGSVLLRVIDNIENGNIHVSGKMYACDNNKALIIFYKNVQKHPKALYESVRQYFDNYNAIVFLKKQHVQSPTQNLSTPQSKEEYYYMLRDYYNEIKHKSSVQASALFIVMNKLCFRGLYRESATGKFNVSFGHYKKSPQFTVDTFNDFSRKIQHIIFNHQDFQTSLRNIKQGDFVYLDPPYAPETKTSFVQYTKDGFNHTMQSALLDSLKSMHKQGVRFVMSNADVKYIRNRTKKHTHLFRTQTIQARRAIHSTQPQTTTQEVLIYNI